MKKLTMFILGCCTGIAAVAQDQEVLNLLSAIDGKWKIDNNNNVYVQEEIEYDAKTKDQLRFLLKEHFIYTFDANYVVQLDDRENDIMIAKGAYTGSSENLTELKARGIKHTFWHIIKCEIKENRMRITVTLTKIDQYSSGGGSVHDGFGGTISGPNTDEYHITDIYPIKTVPTYTVITTKGNSVSAKTVNATKATKNKLMTIQGYSFHYAVSKALNSIEAIKLHIQNSDNKTNGDW